MLKVDRIVVAETISVRIWETIANNGPILHLCDGILRSKTSVQKDSMTGVGVLPYSRNGRHPGGAALGTYNMPASAVLK